MLYEDGVALRLLSQIFVASNRFRQMARPYVLIWCDFSSAARRYSLSCCERRTVAGAAFYFLNSELQNTLYHIVAKKKYRSNC